MVSRALVPNPPDQVLVDDFRLQLTRRDFATLSGLNWLNDEVSQPLVISFYNHRREMMLSIFMAVMSLLKIQNLQSCDMYKVCITRVKSSSLLLYLHLFRVVELFSCGPFNCE